MKWIIASDLHGSAYYCKKLIEFYKSQKAEKILLLGDILYHGPRNELPRDYNPKEVITMLNDISDKIVCVRGNCDGEVDQMVLDFPIMADYAVLCMEGTTIYATHGHIYNADNPVNFAKGNILLCGHFHVPCVKKMKDFIYINDGSLSIPKENSFHSCMTFDGKKFIWFDIENGNQKMEFSVEGNGHL